MNTTKLYCVSGPSSTGKSTLLASLKLALPGTLFIEEWARRLFKVRYACQYKSLDELLPEKAFEYQMALAELTLGNRFDGRVTFIDRAPIDILVYSLMNIGYIGVDITKIMEILMISIKEVDTVFMTRDTGVYEDDGFRPVSYRAKRGLEINMFEHFGEALGSKLVWLPDNTEARVEKVLDYLEADGVDVSSAQMPLIRC